jgi:hypothetical protein
MVEITAAVTVEQGIRFVVVLVKQQAVQPATRETTRRSVSPLFPRDLIVLCAQDSRGTPTYYGRQDIVRFLADVQMHQLPWKKYHSNAA